VGINEGRYEPWGKEEGSRWHRRERKIGSQSGGQRVQQQQQSAPEEPECATHRREAAETTGDESHRVASKTSRPPTGEAAETTGDESYRV
jgi:hypothetical protein